MMLRLIIATSLLSFTACKTTSNNDCVQKAKQPDCVCMTLYDPVCGCNEVTYGNSCEANCDGITQFSKGACKE